VSEQSEKRKEQYAQFIEKLKDMPPPEPAAMTKPSTIVSDNAPSKKLPTPPNKKKEKSKDGGIDLPRADKTEEISPKTEPKKEDIKKGDENADGEGDKHEEKKAENEDDEEDDGEAEEDE